MVSKCANPACSARFLYLHDGRIFVLRSASQRSTDVSDAVDARYWLCGPCSERATLVLRNGSVALEPIAQLAPASLRESAAAPRARRTAA